MTIKPMREKRVAIGAQCRAAVEASAIPRVRGGETSGGMLLT